MPSQETLTHDSRLPNAPVQSRCAFCQAEARSEHVRRDFSRFNRACGPAAAFRCLLNPGKGTGPDGEEINLAACTQERQAECQLHRKKEFARLCTSLPALRRLAL